MFSSELVTKSLKTCIKLFKCDNINKWDYVYLILSSLIASSGFILDSEIKTEYAKIDLAKKQAIELHKAVGKLAKCKADDSYEAGLKANLQNLMEETGLMQINSLLDGVERQKLLDSDGAL